MYKNENHSQQEKLTIGYVYYGYRTLDEKYFLKFAKKNNVRIFMFNLFKKIDLKKAKKRAKLCDLIYVNSGEEKVLKFVKYLEEIGCKVIESSESYYRDENKWALYLKCRKNKISVPMTWLLPNDIESSLKKLEKINTWPIVLKRIYGCQGDFVDKANNIEEAEKIIKKFKRKSKIHHPVIAQKFIHSPSYRILVVDGEIIQTALKEKGFWKKTGVYTKDFKKIKITPALKKIVQKMSRISKINICGIDLLKDSRGWYILELNSSPCFSFFDNEREEIVGKVFDFLMKEIARSKE